MKQKVYNEDMICRLKKIKDSSIDCIVSDIPYKIIAGGVRIQDESDECGGVLNKRAVATCKNPKMKKDVEYWYNNKTNRKLKKDNRDTVSAIKAGKIFDHNDIEFSEYLGELYRVLKEGTHCYLMINSRNLKDLQTQAEKVGFVFQNLLCWVKGNYTPNKYYMQGVEFILMLSKRPARSINNMGSTNVIYTPNPTDKDHPTQKPILLMEYLIKNSTEKGEIVLDPFMGTGATMLASKRLGRGYIGIEIDKHYYRLAKKKLRDVI